MPRQKILTRKLIPGKGRVNTWLEHDQQTGMTSRNSSTRKRSGAITTHVVNTKVEGVGAYSSLNMEKRTRKPEERFEWHHVTKNETYDPKVSKEHPIKVVVEHLREDKRNWKDQSGMRSLTVHVADFVNGLLHGTIFDVDTSTGQRVLRPGAGTTKKIRKINEKP